MSNTAKTLSEHFTKASAQTAASKADVQRQFEHLGSGQARVHHKVIPTGKRIRRWKVVVV